METNHPREETEKQRIYRRRQLREVAESKIKRHGQIFPDPLLDVRDTGIMLENGLPGHITSIKGTMGKDKLDMIKINIYHTEDVTGPFTQYTSRSSGEFTRSDLNPQESGMPSLKEIESLREMGSVGEAEAAESFALGALAAAMGQVERAQAGIDNYPITAQEAINITQQLKSAKIVPLPDF